MSAQTRRFDSPARENIRQQEPAEDGSPRPGSGSNNSRQTRKLQLRNAGFRGGALPTRNISPKSMSSSNWSTTSWLNGSSDVENISPSGRRVHSSAAETRESGGILQDIGNSTATQRPRRAGHRLTSNKALETDEQPSKGTMRQRSVKSKAKITHRKRSLSAETSKYIEHLESELANTQSQLSSITSPSVTREQSSKVRSLNAETKKLQDDLLEWEYKYEERVQQEIDKHFTIENDLRARIRHLEQDAEDSHVRIHELELQVETTKQSMQVAEDANNNLEKRLEIMSELLASTKVDLHAETPGRGRRHVRPKSMLPRFPTASSLMGSPERQAHTQPTSPLSFAHNDPRHGILDSAINNMAQRDQSPEHSDVTSEVESIFSEDSATCDSVTSAETFEAQPSFNPWSVSSRPPQDKSKPARRMRRFGAGSFGPKPLILPRASQRGQYPPLSAPPLEQSKTTPSFFPTRSRTSENGGSPVSGRRRASTTANELTLSAAAESAFHDISEQDIMSTSPISDASPPSAQSDVTTRRFSSAELPVGRNLMDELSAARSKRYSDVAITSASRPPSSSSDDAGYQHIWHDLNAEVVRSPAAGSIENSTTTNPSQAGEDHRTVRSTTPTHRRIRSRSLSIPIGCSASPFSRLRILFGDLWRSPITVARYLIQTVQARMRIPRPLLNVQWWLVGFLLGPMARRQLLSTTRRQSGLLEDSPLPTSNASTLAYGTLDSTSPSVSDRRTRSISGKCGKRAGSRAVCLHQRTKHSPWLWIKFSITLAFAIGVAFKDGPGSLLKTTACRCVRKRGNEDELTAEERQRSASK